MFLVSAKLPVDHDLVFFGDDHEGNGLRYGKGVNQLIGWILDKPNRYAVHLGDEMEGFWIDDPRYSTETTKSCPIEQQRNVLNTYSQLSSEGRLLVLLMGNHTYKLIPKIGDITKDTCERLKIAYGGYWCKLSIQSTKGKPLYKCFLTHGRKSINSTADDPIRRRSNMELQLKRHLFGKAGDAIIMAKGHCHKLLVSNPRPMLYLTTEPGIKQHYTHPESQRDGYIPPENRWYIASGSFLKSTQEGVTSYSEMGEYDPVELGYAVAEVRDGKVQKVYEKVV